MTQPGHDTYQHVDDFFGGGTPSISFKGQENYGQWKGGTIVAIREKQQQTDYKTRKPLTWDDGNPKWVLPVELQTSERNPQDPADDGRRTLWIQSGIERALKEVLRASRAKLRPGGTLYVAWVGGAGEDGDPKQYQAHYTPAAESSADTMLGAPPAQQQAAPAPAQQQQYAAPTPQVPAPAAPAQPSAQQQPPAPAGPPPAPAAAPQGGSLWAEQQPAPFPAPSPAQQPAAPTTLTGVDPAAIDRAYAHLTDEQRTAIKASGMAPEQIAQLYGQPAAPLA